jgi:protein involved in polysaccharide export with SLBB domain
MTVRFYKMKKIRPRPAAAMACAVALACAIATTGCSSSANKALALAPSGPTVPVYSVDQSDYRMVPGDELGVGFMFHRDLDSAVTIQREGEITIKGLGQFYAAGMTTSELEQTIFRRASLTYRNPDVSVVISSRQTYRAYVGGEVRRPGYVDVRPGLTSMRAIFDRGGFLDTAKINNVLHVRWNDAGRYQARIVDLQASLETGDVRNDVVLGPNDVVFVPKTRVANADLWVSQYILKLIPIRPPTTRLPEFGAPWDDE